MRTISMTLATAVALLSGCMTTDAQMNIIDRSGQSDLLIGEIVPLDGIDFRKINFQVSNFSTACQGQSLNGQRELGMTRDTYKHEFPITCSNGDTGIVRIRFATGGRPFIGTGIGRMDDGSEIRITIGETAGTLTW